MRSALCGFSNVIVGEPTGVGDNTLISTYFHMDYKSIASYPLFFASPNILNLKAFLFYF